MQKIVGVRRYKDREIYYFLQNIDDLRLRDNLVVNFDDFQTVVEVVKLGLETEDEKATDLPKIIRKANRFDLIKYENLIKRAEEFLPIIKRKSLELGLMMKFVSAEYSLDNSKIIIVFSSEERVDFRQFLKELALMLKIRIELKQIGQRDEIKTCGGVGVCGQECCCSRFLKEFEHVTVKMAKNQGLSLSPTKINGVCGRLMCCLAYESDMYEKMMEKMPKVGSKIKTPNGEATVVYNDILRERVTVKRQSDNESVVIEDFLLEEILSGKKLPSNKPDENLQLDEFLNRNSQFGDSSEKQSFENKQKNPSQTETKDSKFDLKQKESHFSFNEHKNPKTKQDNFKKEMNKSSGFERDKVAHISDGKINNSNDKNLINTDRNRQNNYQTRNYNGAISNVQSKDSQQSESDDRIKNFLKRHIRCISDDKNFNNKP